MYVYNKKTIDVFIVYTIRSESLNKSKQAENFKKTNFLWVTCTVPPPPWQLAKNGSFLSINLQIESTVNFCNWLSSLYLAFIISSLPYYFFTISSKPVSSCNKLSFYSFPGLLVANNFVDISDNWSYSLFTSTISLFSKGWIRLSYFLEPLFSNSIKLEYISISNSSLCISAYLAD